jgi:hypothetical protein
MRHNRLALMLLCAALILCAAGLAEAQSGRRAKGGASAPKPVSTPAESESAAAKKSTIKAEAQRVALIVTADGHGFESVYAPANASDIVLRGFVDRLRESSAFTIKVEKEMSRGRASDRAKDEKEAYLVWLHFGSDAVTARSHDDADYFVDYVVFTPGTAKVKTEGKVYLRPSRRNVSIGRVPVGIPLPQTDARAVWEGALKQGGSEAAERVMAEFDVIVR